MDGHYKHKHPFHLSALENFTLYLLLQKKGTVQYLRQALDDPLNSKFKIFEIFSQTEVLKKSHLILF